ncbi:MAG: DUF58 domain-containing protein [Planctomycetota bacterium]
MADSSGLPASNPDDRPPEVDASLYLHPQTLARLKSFELRAKTVVEGVVAGQHRSPTQGFSVEFAQHRAYSPGDDLRHLDWKVYGRTDKLHLKQYQQETSLDVFLLIDSSGSMNFGARSFEDASGQGVKKSLDGRDYWSKFDHATALAAAISYVTLQQGDRAGMSVFADTVRHGVRSSSAQGAWRQIVGALATHPVDRPTDLPRVMDETLAGATNRKLLVLVSDFFCETEEVRTALARVRGRGHDAILFQILDGAELEFPFTDAMPFEGLEGEGRLRVDPRALRQGYLEAINRHVKAIEKLARSFGYDHHVVRTDDWLGPPLAAFLARRNAQHKRSRMG